MKGKGCLILGYVASASGYILGAAVAVRRMLSGISAAELIGGSAAFFPSFSPLGILSLTGLTLAAICSGLSASGIVTALPCAAAGAYLYGTLSAAAFAAYGGSGTVMMLWALPLTAVAFILLSRVSGEGLRYSFFTLRRLGLITEAKGQYADPDDVMDLKGYLLRSLEALGIALLATLYGHLASARIFPL